MSLPTPTAHRPGRDRPDCRVELLDALQTVAPELRGMAEIEARDYTGQAAQEARRAAADWRRATE